MGEMLRLVAWQHSHEFQLQCGPTQTYHFHLFVARPYLSLSQKKKNKKKKSAVQPPLCISGQNQVITGGGSLGINWGEGSIGRELWQCSQWWSVIKQVQT